MKKVRRWLRDKFGIWTSKQNLMECPKCGTAHGLPWYGRNWLHISERKVIECCWVWFMRRNNNFCLSLAIGGGDSDTDVTFHIAVPLLCSLFLSAEGFIPSQCRKIDGHWVDFSRSYELRYDLQFGTWGSLWWKMGANENEWRSDEPRWKRGCFDPADFVLGREKCTTEKLSSHEALVTMPEGQYPVVVTFEKRTWRRKRWPFPRVRFDTDVDCGRGIPIPGKGENSWDCGEDAICATGVDASTVDEAVVKMAAKVQERRDRYEGPDWRPRKTEVAS